MEKYNYLENVTADAKAAILEKDDATMKKSRRRLNPIYWIFQYLGGLVAIGSLFFIPYIIEKILGC